MCSGRAAIVPEPDTASWLPRTYEVERQGETEDAKVQQGNSGFEASQRGCPYSAHTGPLVLLTQHRATSCDKLQLWMVAGSSLSSVPGRIGLNPAAMEVEERNRPGKEGKNPYGRGRSSPECPSARHGQDLTGPWRRKLTLFCSIFSHTIWKLTWHYPLHAPVPWDCWVDKTYRKAGGSCCLSYPHVSEDRIKLSYSS